MFVPTWRRNPVPRLVITVVVCAGALLGCTLEPPATELDDAVAREAATQPADMVDVTLYFRHGRGRNAYLTPVVREVAVGSDLARTALDLLLKGPSSADAAELEPPLPTSTTVRGFSVEDATATVDLSRHAVTAAEEVGKRPEHELLALAALANTLTEFPDISRVALRIDGQRGGEFWGGWGLPDVLLRDDSVIGPTARVSELPPLAAFSRRPQQAGNRRSSAVVSSVRVRPRATYLRVTVELTDAEGGDLLGTLPKTSATPRGGAIRVSVGAPAAKGLASNQVVADPGFADARIDVRQSPSAVNVTVRPQAAADFALRTLSNPARVVLDIRR